MGLCLGPQRHFKLNPLCILHQSDTSGGSGNLGVQWQLPQGRLTEAWQSICIKWTLQIPTTKRCNVG